MSVRFEMRVDDALMAEVDSARGTVTRAAWIKGAIQGRLRTTAAFTSKHAPKAERVERARQVVKGDGDPIPKIAPRHWA